MPQSLSNYSLLRKHGRLLSVTEREDLRFRLRHWARWKLGVPREALHSLGWDVAAGACAGIYLGMTMPFLIRIARAELHASDFAIGVMNAAPFVGNLLAPVWARQMEGKAKMPFCQVSWITGRSLLLLMPLAATAWGFVGIIALLLFIGTISSPAYTSLMKDIYPDRARGQLMSYVRIIVQAFTFLSTLVTGRLMDRGVGFGPLFAVAGVAGILAAIFFRKVRPLPSTAPPSLEPPQPLPSFLVNTLGILKENQSYRWFALSVMLYGFGNLMAWPLYQLYQVEHLHIRPTQIANLTNVTSLCAMVGSLFWGRFIDRHGAAQTVFRAILLITSISVVYFFAHSVSLLYAASFLSGFGMAGIELSYTASILNYAEHGKAARYQALHSLLLGIRGVLAPLVALPLLHVIGYQGVFIITFLFMLLGAYLQWRATKALEIRPV